MSLQSPNLFSTKKRESRSWACPTEGLQSELPVFEHFLEARFLGETMALLHQPDPGPKYRLGQTTWARKFGTV